MVTPHGEFDKFSMRKRGTGADSKGVGDYGKGFYFTPHKNIALSYATELSKRRGDIKKNAPTLYTVELDMKNPFDMRILMKIQRSTTDLIKRYGVFNIPQEELDNMYDKIGITPDDEEFYRDVGDLIGDNWGDWNIQNKLKERGFDSLISYDGSEYVVYSPKQIKILNVERLSNAK